VGVIAMKLPNGERAIIDERKPWGYVLNPKHPEGAAHAFLFSRLLGLDLSNWTILRDCLRQAAKLGEALPGRPSPYGAKFEIRHAMSGPRGTYAVLSVWMIRANERDPQLVTTYIE
jgi:hypothetical protein